MCHDLNAANFITVRDVCDIRMIEMVTFCDGSKRPRVVAFDLERTSVNTRVSPIQQLLKPHKTTHQIFVWYVPEFTHFLSLR